MSSNKRYKVKKCPDGGKLSSRYKLKSIPQAENGLNTLWGGNSELTGVNLFTGNTIEFDGNKHEQDGIGINFNGTTVEVEGGETAFKSNDGSLNVMGQMKIPFSNKTFKTRGKEIAKQENASMKQMDKGMILINEKDPLNKYSAVGFNAGLVKKDAATQRQKALAREKEDLANIQNFMLDLSDENNLTPKQVSSVFNGKKLRKGGRITSYPDGGKVRENNRWLVRNEAKKAGLDPNIVERLAYQESGFNQNAQSPAGALGIMQFIPSTAKQYGLTKEQLTSDKPEDRYAVVQAGIKHFKSLLEQNGNDYQLALAAYNGGQGAVNYVKKQLGKDNITGDDWMNFMNQRRELSPSSKDSAWQNQTYEYVRNISDLGDEAFFSNNNERGAGDIFRGKYYENERNRVDIEPIPINTQPTPISTNINPELRQLPISNNSPYIEQTPNTTTPTKDKVSLADTNKLGVRDFLSELMYLADRPDYVQGQQYQPQLFQPYQVSFQDRLNENQASFNSLQRTISNNPSALSTLAGQKYQADSTVLADQFRTNQAIQNDITNRNVSLLNDAQLKNLELSDLQFTRQEQAKANTKTRKYQALANIANRVAENKKQNLNLRMAENIYGFGANNQGEFNWQGGAAPLNLQGIAQDPNAETIVVYDKNDNPIKVTKRKQSANQDLLDHYKVQNAKNEATKLY